MNDDGKCEESSLLAQSIYQKNRVKYIFICHPSRGFDHQSYVHRIARVHQHQEGFPVFLLRGRRGFFGMWEGGNRLYSRPISCASRNDDMTAVFAGRSPSSAFLPSSSLARAAISDFVRKTTTTTTCRMRTTQCQKHLPTPTPPSRLKGIPQTTWASGRRRRRRRRRRSNNCIR